MLNSLLCTQQSSFCNVSVPRDLLQAHTVQKTKGYLIVSFRTIAASLGYAPPLLYFRFLLAIHELVRIMPHFSSTHVTAFCETPEV